MQKSQAKKWKKLLKGQRIFNEGPTDLHFCSKGLKADIKVIQGQFLERTVKKRLCLPGFKLRTITTEDECAGFHSI